MKRIILLTALIASTAICNAQNTTLDKIENSIFGYTYATESDNSRLDRIEQNVYGKTSNATNQARISKLNKDLSVNEMGQEISPKEDTFVSDEDSWVFAKEPVENSKMDYPVINELEKSVFNKEFKDQNIRTRLTNLEKKTFGKSYDNDELSNRVDRLKAEIKPKTFMANNMEKQDNLFYDNEIGKMDQDYHLDSYGDPFDYDSYNSRRNVIASKPLSLSSIEKTLYRTKFENEPTAKRLSRIESSVFGTTFPNDSDGERISRISSAIAAQKSARKYDSNRFNQNMATAFQIGTLILMVLACIL